MSGNLQGCKVLVTRPKEQGEKLCQLVEEDGGTAIPFPTLELSKSEDMDRPALIKLITAASRVIFISSNAVEFAWQITGDLMACLRGKMVIAVGDGTLRKLARHDIYSVIAPGVQAGSEALLDMPELDAKNIQGKNVLIVRGGTGREFLHEGLVARGAIVQYANVYQRSQPAVPREIIDAVWHKDCPDIIVATSEQGLHNLIRMTAEQDRGIMFSRKLVVLSVRLAEAAKATGFVSAAVVATDQSDQGLLQAIRQTVG